MIKYGIDGRELKKPDNSELVLTGRGFVRRQKEEKQRSGSANEVAKKVAKDRNEKPNKGILAAYAGSSADNFKNEDERNWNKISKLSGGNENE
mgnify:FL=1